MSQRWDNKSKYKKKVLCSSLVDKMERLLLTAASGYSLVRYNIPETPHSWFRSGLNQVVITNKVKGSQCGCFGLYLTIPASTCNYKHEADKLNIVWILLFMFFSTKIKWQKMTVGRKWEKLFEQPKWSSTKLCELCVKAIKQNNSCRNFKEQYKRCFVPFTSKHRQTFGAEMLPSTS